MKKLLVLVPAVLAVAALGCAAGPVESEEDESEDLFSSSPTLEEEAICNASVTCGDNTTRSCSGISSCTTSGTNGYGAWVKCDGVTKSCPAAPSCTCGVTGTSSFSGTRAAGLGYYTYPEVTFTVACCTGNKTITVNASALDVPNRFNVYDGNNNYRGSTGWLGSTTQGGPWGSSLNNSGSGFVSFSGGNGTYKIRVETSTTDRSDYWSAYAY